MIENYSHYDDSIFRIGRQINESIIEKSLDRFLTRFDKHNTNQLPKKISILGFAFKGTPETADMRGSPVYKVLECIRRRYKHKYILSGHD